MHNLLKVGDLESLRTRAVEGFRQKFGETPALVSHAPGRVNLIGEHTDYNDGFVFPAAIDRHVVIAAAKAPDATKVWSEGFEEPAVFDSQRESTTKGWARFPSGCAWTLLRAGHRPSNVNAYVVSDLPLGAGLSSSAAMELALLTLWSETDSLRLDPKELALMAQRCEHEFIGVLCGVMDQMASAFGREGCAMLLDTRSLEIEYAPIPEGLAIVVCLTSKERELSGSAYNERRNQCEGAAGAMGLASLRDASLDLLDGTFPHREGVQYRRARHVITENERCLEFATALANDDRTAIGRLMMASHESLRDDYEVSCDELDWMAESAWSARGCVGARMTGAGFGGSCVALVESGELEGFLGDAEKGYRDRSNGQDPSFLVCRAAAGAGLV